MRFHCTVSGFDLHACYAIPATVNDILSPKMFYTCTHNNYLDDMTREGRYSGSECAYFHDSLSLSENLMCVGAGAGEEHLFGSALV